MIVFSLLISCCFALSPKDGVGAIAHDFHVSRLTVNHDVKQRRLQMTLQTYVDDLERGLITEHQLGLRASADLCLPAAADVNLLAPQQHPRTDSLLEAYMRKHLVIRFGEGPTLPWQLLGVERGDDPYAMFIYLTVSQPQNAESVRLRSTFLTDVFDDQQNVVIWQRNGQASDYDLLTAEKVDCKWSR